MLVCGYSLSKVRGLAEKMSWVGGGCVYQLCPQDHLRLHCR